MIETNSLTAEDAGNEDPVERTDDLDDKTCNRQDEGSLEEGFSLAAFPFSNIYLTNEKHRLNTIINKLLLNYNICHSYDQSHFSQNKEAVAQSR